MHKIFSVLLALLTVLALSGCGTTATGVNSPVRVETLTGTMPEQAGMQLQAFDALGGGTGTPLVAATVGDSGQFTLDLPDSVEAAQLTSGDSAFGCEEVPAVNLAMIASLALSDESEAGAAALVPEGTTSIGAADRFAVFVYSDRDVSIDITCTVGGTTPTNLETTAESGQLLTLTLVLALGWNIVLQSSTADGTLIQTGNIPSNFFWLYNVAP